MVKGYDGVEIAVGDRVEVHPATEFWVRGAKFGTVISFSLTPKDQVKVKLDKVPGLFSGSADTFRKVV